MDGTVTISLKDFEKLKAKADEYDTICIYFDNVYGEYHRKIDETGKGNVKMEELDTFKRLMEYVKKEIENLW